LGIKDMMNMAQRVAYAIDDAANGKLGSALMHACAALDGTGARLFPDKRVRDRFVETFHRYLWVIEPMLAIGINLEETTFKWIALKNRPSLFSEVVYEIFRCNLVHGTDIPKGFGVALRHSKEHRSVTIGQQEMTIPDTIIFALLGAVVFSSANANERINNGNYWLSCGTMQFTIDQWWGREADAQICFSTVKLPRITVNFDAQQAVAAGAAAPRG
jgi:hypothetical protein